MQDLLALLYYVSPSPPSFLADVVSAPSLPSSATVYFGGLAFVILSNQMRRECQFLVSEPDAVAGALAQKIGRAHV